MIGAALAAAIFGILLGPGDRRRRDGDRPRGRVLRRSPWSPPALAAWVFADPGHRARGGVPSVRQVAAAILSAPGAVRLLARRPALDPLRRSSTC